MEYSDLTQSIFIIGFESASFEFTFMLDKWTYRISCGLASLNFSFILLQSENSHIVIQPIPVSSSHDLVVFCSDHYLRSEPDKRRLGLKVSGARLVHIMQMRPQVLVMWPLRRATPYKNFAHPNDPYTLFLGDAPCVVYRKIKQLFV